MKRIANHLLCLTIVFVIMAAAPLSVHAAAEIDADRDVHFTISYQKDGMMIPGAQFDLYRVAEVDAYGHMTILRPFSGYPIQVASMDQEKWDTLASTLKGYVWRDSIASDFSGATDTEGNLTLTVKPGLYLVIGSRRTIGAITYSAAPFMVVLPGMSQSETQWLYDYTACPKADGAENPSDDPDDHRITRKVLKIWDDAGYEQKRPQRITVQLLCDGSLFDTVTLTRENNWRWAWDNLERDHDWTVVEKELPGYATEVSQEGVTFTVKNTYQAAPSTQSPRPYTPGSTLPRTGLLWWPVLPLFTAGLLFLIIGLIRRRSRKDAS